MDLYFYPYTYNLDYTNKVFLKNGDFIVSKTIDKKFGEKLFSNEILNKIMQQIQVNSLKLK